MKKFLLILIITPPNAHAMNITLPESIISFDAETALIELAESLESNSITEKKCSRLYTGIYTKALLQQAELVIKWQQKSEDDETISYFDATIQACKDISRVMIPPESRLSVRQKIIYFLTPSPKH